MDRNYDARSGGRPVTVPLDRIDLSPPIGYGKGLPLTMSFKTSGSYGVTGAIAGRVDAATDLWQRGENTNLGDTFAAMWTIGTPVLDSIKGFLFNSQFIAGQAPAPYSADSDNAWQSYAQSTGVTYSSPGRSRGIKPRASTPATSNFFSNSILGDGNGPIGNHAHQVGPIEQISNSMLAGNTGVTGNLGGYGRMYSRTTTANLPVLYDTAIGTELSVFKSSESAQIGHQSQVALASGGNGRQWGDAHDTIYNATLASSCLAPHVHPNYGMLHTATGLHDSRMANSRLFAEPSHWVINLYSQAHHPFSRQPLTAASSPIDLTDNLSSPPNHNDVEISATASSGGTFDLEYYKRDMANWLQPNETAQAFAITEPIDGTESIRELGPAYLGNHAVFDTVGLIGYEGAIIASAFFTISNDGTRDSSQTSAPFVYPSSGDVGMHFAGLNIQVTSGTPIRRAGMLWLPSGSKATRYGSDGKLVAPMMDCMRTTGSMKTHDGTIVSDATDTNKTTFFTGRTGFDSITPIGSNSSVIRAIDNEDVEIARSVHPEQYILGDTEALSDAFADSQTTIGGTGMVGTEKIGARWMADYVPTKVKVVPSLVGYEEVDVDPGQAKEGIYQAVGTSPLVPSTIRFKKPIVDYHIIVTLAKRPSGDIRQSNPSGSGYSFGGRNNPYFDEPCQLSMDMSEQEYVIMHGIFRINPTTLEQVYQGDTIGDFGGGRNGFEYSMTNGYDQVMPRHESDNSIAGRMGWGLHQATPFRPIRSAQWDKVPTFMGAIEPAGMYQRGGISPLFDADAYGGELFVSANLNDCTALGGGTSSTDAKTGKDWFGKVWQFGQKWDGAPQVSPGQELMIFRYSPANDPWYPPKKNTTLTETPLYERINALSATNYLYGTYDTDLHNDRHTTHSGGLILTTDEMALTQGTDGNSWGLHDWVFPRIELMKYLGVEDKAAPATYPILSCSALRIMEDGRMMMAAVQRDSITGTGQYPDSVIGYPPNPDNAYPRCPPGYYFDGTTCQPMMATPATSSLGGHYNPDAEADTAAGNPAPQTPPSSSAPSLDSSTIFGDYPTFTKLAANSGARSMILLWTETPAKNGKVTQGKCDFSGKWSSDHAGGFTWTQTFNHPDTWWSGARTSYWFPESGQRAIPTVYGAYPEVRLSNVSLPRSTPNISPLGAVIEGYPLTQLVGRMAQQVSGHLYGGHATTGTIYATDSTFMWSSQYLHFDSQWSEHQNWLKRTWHVPTIYGASDFASGCRPLGHRGWSSWSLPADLIDPMWRVTNQDFPREGPNAAQQIHSGFSSSMGHHHNPSWFTNNSWFSDPVSNRLQSIWLCYDFGLVEHFPQGIGSKKGSIKGMVYNGMVNAVTPTSFADVGEINAWIQASPDSPFQGNIQYGTSLVEGNRIVIPVLLSAGSTLGDIGSFILNMGESANTGGEHLIVEPFFSIPPNLTDPDTFTVTP